jgi:L-rhamnose-H+ transport protein
MSFGLQGGPGIEQLPDHGAVYVDGVEGNAGPCGGAAGRFVVNGVWCIFLNVKNKTGGDYVKKDVPILLNLVFAGVAEPSGAPQFICFKTGEPQMGDTSYIGWSVLMASQILFSQLLGLFLANGKGRVKRRVRCWWLVWLC